MTVKEQVDKVKNEIIAAEKAFSDAAVDATTAKEKLEELQRKCAWQSPKGHPNKEKTSGPVDCSGDCQYRCLDCGAIWWG